MPERLITSNSYDELGQLISKNVGGADTSGAIGLQAVDYSYNIRGWLKDINNVENMGADLFAFKINYNDFQSIGPNDIAPSPLYNGNISATYWKTSSDNLAIKKYNYSYDNLNRLTDATYLKTDTAINDINAYDENLSYDKNGNIKTLLRNGGINAGLANPIDNLTYKYDSSNKNLLLNVTDATTSPQGFKDVVSSANDYSYDANGNMIKDNNKDIKKITYNHLNLPTQILVGTNTIDYLYNAIGQKVRKTVKEGTTITKTDYLAGGFQYKNSALQFFPHAEGYVKNTSGTYSYVFNYTDHLGNIRLSYSDINKNGSIEVAEVLEENQYYPFGLKHETTITSNAYQYKYNGKELQTELGLNVYDYGARNYDPALGRYMNLDFFTESFENKTPYHYVSNNPVNKVDVLGHFEITVNDRSKFKKTVSYLENGISEILKNPGIMAGLQKYGNFNEQQVKDLIIGKKGIKLAIDYNYGPAYGEYLHSDKRIHIHESLAYQVENATTEEEKELAILALITTVLHESVHYGDRNLKDEPETNTKKHKFYSNEQQGEIYSQEIGEAFETAVFWNGDIDAFDQMRSLGQGPSSKDGYKHGKTGINNMKKLARNKLDKGKIGDLTQGLQNFITRIQKDRPDLEIFIIE